VRAVVGVDPGARETGVVLSIDGQLIEWEVVRRDHATALLNVPRAYLERINDKIGAYIDLALRSECADVVVAIESVTVPNVHHNGKRQVLSPEGPMATALVYGAVFGQNWTASVVSVEPGGNGSLPFTSYPEALRPKDGGKGSDVKRHVRSAWDVARKAKVRLAA